jgi:RNA-directed DNA polymerase
LLQPEAIRRGLLVTAEHEALLEETEELVGELNLVLKGWGNYFRLGSVSKAYRAVDGHARHRLRQWLCHKHKVKGHDRNRFKDEYLYQKLGLFRLCASALICRGRKHKQPCPKAGCGKSARPV